MTLVDVFVYVQMHYRIVRSDPHPTLLTFSANLYRRIVCPGTLHKTYDHLVAEFTLFRLHMVAERRKLTESVRRQMASFTDPSSVTQRHVDDTLQDSLKDETVDRR